MNDITTGVCERKSLNLYHSAFRCSFKWGARSSQLLYAGEVACISKSQLPVLVQTDSLEDWENGKLVLIA